MKLHCGKCRFCKPNKKGSSVGICTEAANPDDNKVVLALDGCDLGGKHSRNREMPGNRRLPGYGGW